MSREHPQNGSTFSQAPAKKARPMTEAELATYYQRKKAQEVETIASCAKTKEFNVLLRIDRRAALKWIGIDLPAAPAPLKRRF